MWNKPTPEELAELPRSEETEDLPLTDRIIHMHFFIAGCDWYIAEYNGEGYLWGFCNIGDDLFAEWGEISLEELDSIKIQGYLEVDRDLYWEKRPAGEIPEIARCPGAW